MIDSKTDISQYEILDLLYNYQIAKSKIELFTKKYSMDFSTFEKYINNSTIENFEEWDDYIEWKAYSRIESEKFNKMKEFKHEPYQLS
jgi:hypothetical protein